MPTLGHTQRQPASLWGMAWVGPVENPREPYEALSRVRRSSILERGRSTTKRGHAVSTRVYQSDLPS